MTISIIDVIFNRMNPDFINKLKDSLSVLKFRKIELPLINNNTLWLEVKKMVSLNEFEILKSYASYLDYGKYQMNI